MKIEHYPGYCDACEERLEAFGCTPEECHHPRVELDRRAQQHRDNTPSCPVCGYAPQVRGCVAGKCGRKEP